MPAEATALGQQRDYLADMLDQVRAGKDAGKSAEALAAGINLAKHGSFGANAEANATSIRAVSRRIGPN
jgi:hypothetical protein